MQKIELWKDPGKMTLEPELFSKTAEDLAREIGEESKHSKGTNKRTQIRKFYDEVVRLTSLAKSRPEEWQNILPMVHMITAKAAYARGRNLISSSFMDFIRNCISQVNRPEDLNVFSNFFEAFMGFYRLHGPNN